MRTKILAILLIFFIGFAGAVTIPAPTYNWGAYSGLKNPGTIQAADLEATDDCKIGDDFQVVDDTALGGDLAVTGASTFAAMYLSGGLNVAGTSALNVTTATTVTASGTIRGEQLTSTDDALVYGTLTANDVVSNTTVAASDVTASDDAIITDDLVVDGAARIDEASTIASLTINTTLDTNGDATFENVSLTQNKKLIFNTAGTGYIQWLTSGNYMTIKGNPQFDDGYTWSGTASPSSASDLNAIGGASDINYTLSSGILVTPTGAATFQGNNTVAANKALAVTTADKLTVGGKIIPQEMVLTFPYTASSVDQQIFTAKEAWNITAVRLVPRVVGGDASPVNVTVTVCDDAEAPASGVAALSAVLDLKGTADTIQSGTLNATNVAVASGDSVAVNFTGTLTSAVGVVTVYLKRV